jgi:hypothetical protein
MHFLWQISQKNSSYLLDCSTQLTVGVSKNGNGRKKKKKRRKRTEKDQSIKSMGKEKGKMNE